LLHCLVSSDCSFSSISPDNKNRGMSQKLIPLSLH
jgi:hypothetical protein